MCLVFLWCSGIASSSVHCSLCCSSSRHLILGIEKVVTIKYTWQVLVICYLYGLHKCKFASPSLLIVFTIYFLFLKMTGWIFILFFYCCGIEQKVCKDVANKCNGLQKAFSFPMNLLSWKKSHSHFEITTYSSLQYGSEKGMEVEKNWLSSCQIIMQL